MCQVCGDLAKVTKYVEAARRGDVGGMETILGVESPPSFSRQSTYVQSPAYGTKTGGYNAPADTYGGQLTY